MEVEFKDRKIKLYDQLSKARDVRDGDWYWIDRKILKLYGRKLGTSGIAVYNTLASFTDSKTQSCYPARKTIARILGVSRKTVTRKIKLLDELGLVKIEKVKRSFRYLLLEVSEGMTKKTVEGDKRDTSWATTGRTNNNQLLKININNRDDDKFFKTLKEFNPKNREELLASDLAEALNDRQGFGSYLFYAKKYPESFLRRTLGEVKEIPDGKIKKGRAALFHYLIQKHVKKTI